MKHIFKTISLINILYTYSWTCIFYRRCYHCLIYYFNQKRCYHGNQTGETDIVDNVLKASIVLFHSGQLTVSLLCKLVC